MCCRLPDSISEKIRAGTRHHENPKLGRNGAIESGGLWYVAADTGGVDEGGAFGDGEGMPCPKRKSQLDVPQDIVASDTCPRLRALTIPLFQLLVPIEGL